MPCNNLGMHPSWLKGHLLADERADFESIATLIGRLTARTGDQSMWVFRGVRDDSWTVQSSLYRRIAGGGEAVTEDVMRGIEEGLIATARKWGIGAHMAGAADDLHLLALMQHYGVPTRLLDVTRNPYTALFFAAQRDRDAKQGQVETDGLLLAFNVTGLPHRRSAGDDEVQSLTWQGPLPAPKWRWDELLRCSKSKKQWFVVTPGVVDRRMTAQEGLFIGSSVPDVSADPLIGMHAINKPLFFTEMIRQIILHDDGQLDSNAIAGPDLFAIPIPAKIKPTLRRILYNTFGRSAMTMFPDLQGLAETLGPKRVALEAD